MASVEDCSSENDSIYRNGNDNSRNLQDIGDISKEIENYLNSEDVINCTDPKLKKEKQKLIDILESYKKLIDKLEKKCSDGEVNKEVKGKIYRTPEIYAILHPELYKNIRDDEKNKLIQKFSKKKLFTEVDRIVPPHCQTPVFCVPDPRLEEKERFIALLSRAPARFLNCDDLPSVAAPHISKRRNPVRKACSLSPRDERDDEKERLARIFATSKVADLKKRLTEVKRIQLSPRSEETAHISSHKRDTYESTTSGPTPREEDISQDHTDNLDMVRAGEYSPVNYHNKGPVHLGVGEHEERKHQLSHERRRDYRNHLAHMEKRCEEGKADKARYQNEGQEGAPGYRRALQSTSTQTDSSLLEQPSLYNVPNSLHFDSPRNLAAPTQRSPYYVSPREKLMSDLHGDSHCFPGDADADSDSEKHKGLGAKFRQVAYAEALKQQIDEKKRLEEEKRKKEQEEEETFERRLRVQQERIQSEYVEEHCKRQDWLAQRQSQEEILRRKIIEMELEAKELKKQERRKKCSSVCETSEISRRESRKGPQSVHTGSPTPAPPGGAVPHSRNTYTVRDSRMERINRALAADTHDPVGSQRTKAPAVAKCKAEAEELLRAPLDFRIDRPGSPPIPAVRTNHILSNNSRLLDHKWQIPKEGSTLARTMEAPAPGHGEENILTQLGQFRRQLAEEHKRLEARLQRHTPQP